MTTRITPHLQFASKTPPVATPGSTSSHPPFLDFKKEGKYFVLHIEPESMPARLKYASAFVKGALYPIQQGIRFLKDIARKITQHG